MSSNPTIVLHAKSEAFFKKKKKILVKKGQSSQHPFITFSLLGTFSNRVLGIFTHSANTGRPAQFPETSYFFLSFISSFLEKMQLSYLKKK